MKTKHSPKPTSIEKERKTKAKRDIPQMQSLEEEEESYDQPLRSQRLAQKRAAKEFIEAEATPAKKSKKGEEKKDVPIKSPPKETKTAARAPEKGVVIKDVQEKKSKKEEPPKGKGKQKMYPKESTKESKSKGKLYKEDNLEDLELVLRPKANGKEKPPINFNSLPIKSEREVVFTSLRIDVKVTFEEELKEIGLLKFIQEHVKGKYSPELVKEFYTNAKVFHHKEEDQDMVISAVQGKIIVVKAKILEKVFELPKKKGSSSVNAEATIIMDTFTMNTSNRDIEAYSQRNLGDRS